MEIWLQKQKDIKNMGYLPYTQKGLDNWLEQCLEVKSVDDFEFLLWMLSVLEWSNSLVQSTYIVLEKYPLKSVLWLNLTSQYSMSDQSFYFSDVDL